MRPSHRIGIPALAFGRGLAEAGFVLAVKAGLSGHESFLLLAAIPALVLLRFVFQDRGAVLEAAALRDGVANLRRKLLDTLRHRAVPAWRPATRRALDRALDADIPLAAEGALARRRFIGSCLEGAVLLPLLFLLAWKAALVGVAAALLLWPALRWRNRTMKTLERAGAAGHDAARHAREDFTHSLESLPATGPAGFAHEVAQLDQTLTEAHAPQWRWRRAQARYPALLETLLFFVLCVILFTGALTLQGLEPVLLFAMLLLLAYRPLREAARQYPVTVAGARAARDIDALVTEWERYTQRTQPDAHPDGNRIAARNVTFAYETETRNDDGSHGRAERTGARPVFKNITLDCAADVITGLTGPNGAGKTTLLRLLSGAETTGSGQILWPESVRARGLAYLPQRSWPGHDWAAWAAHYKATHTVKWAELDALLGLERLTARAAHPETLSGGERQRMTLARVLTSDAAYLLLDEPTTALPADEREHVLRGALAFWKKHGQNQDTRGALIVSHEPFLANLCDNVVRLDSASGKQDV